MSSVVCLWTAVPAQAFNIYQPVPVQVVEYKNIHLDHYFLTSDTQEMAGIDAGSAGPGWIRTGYGFTAYSANAYPCGLCAPVSRFYGTPGLGPNSHFYTAGAEEAQGLKRPGTGWSFERVAFGIEVAGASGACRSGLTPVYRFYNNRWMSNDSNHRYVTRDTERAAMTAAGWIDEGVRFCSAEAVEVPFAIASIGYIENAILPSAQCEDESVHVGSCLAVNNLPVPDKLVGPLDSAAALQLSGLTGYYWDYLYAPAPGSADFLARDVFVQPAGPRVGIHVDTRRRGRSAYSSLNPLFQFRTQPTAGRDERFFPWRITLPFETQLAITGSVNVITVVTRNSASHAYGHPTIEFIDERSGRHLYFTTLAYGTVAGADFVAPDVVTRKVIVGTTLRADTPYGRNLGGVTLSTPSGYRGDPNGFWLEIDFRIDRGEFQRILAAARAVDPALSADPADYLVDNFHFTNEVVGEGEIGTMQQLSLQVLRR